MRSYDSTILEEEGGDQMEHMDDRTISAIFDGTSTPSSAPCHSAALAELLRIEAAYQARIAAE